MCWRGRDSHREPAASSLAAIKVWAAGIKAPDFLRDIDGLEMNRINQLVVQRTWQTTRDKTIFAMGDYPLDESGKTVPPRASKPRPC